MAAPEQHALCGASSAHIWLICTAMPRACEGVPDLGSPYAAEGHLAHEVAELKLRKALTEPIAKQTFTKRMNALKAKEFYNEEMQGYTDEYLEQVKAVVYSFKSKPHIALEQQLHFEEWVPEGFGTGDCVIIGERVLHIFDFKYGKGQFVSAYQNPQMRLYALGAMKQYAPLFDIEKVVMHICQPRLNNAGIYEEPKEDLLAWGESIKPAAQKAFYGFGVFIPGDHCQFCRIAATCRKRVDTNMAVIHSLTVDTPAGPALPNTPYITDEEVGAILAELNQLGVIAWAKKLDAYALHQLLNDKPIPGWKVVAGRGNRAFDDTDKAIDILKTAGFKESVLFTREPKSVAELEGLVGRKQFSELLDAHITKSPGKPTIAPESDPREPYKKPTAADDFTNAPTPEKPTTDNRPTENRERE